ncbi:MAG: hypothetical protein AB9869_26770 [Verrucomicrobiia bacterium]
MKRLIWIAAFPLAPHFGATSTKACGIIQALSESFRITVLTNSDRCSSAECAAEMELYWGKNPPVDLRVIPSQAKRRRVAAPIRLQFLNEAQVDEGRIRAEVGALARGASVPVVLDDAILSRLLGTIGQPVLHSPHDCLSRLYRVEARDARRLLTRLKFFYRFVVISRYERNFYRFARSVHLVNEDDARMLRAQDSRINVFLCPIPSLLTPADRHADSDRDIDILIWGNYGSGPVRDGGVRAMEWIREKQLPDMKIVVLGRNARLLPSAQVETRERVANLPEFLRRVKVCLLPDSDGAGVKYRGLDALSQSVCLAGIRSQLGGLPTPLDYCIHAETIEEVIRAVRAAVEDGSYAKFAAAGLTAFRQYLTPKAVGERFTEHLEEFYFRPGVSRGQS